VLGMPSGGCRRPLGRMSAKGLEKVLAVARGVQAKNPEILDPIEVFFKVDVAARLANPASWQGLAYDDY
jgi:4-hydroxy-tetrahydrodipicolinate synthase